MWGCKDYFLTDFPFFFSSYTTQAEDMSSNSERVKGQHH